MKKSHLTIIYGVILSILIHLLVLAIQIHPDGKGDVRNRSHIKVKLIDSNQEIAFIDPAQQELNQSHKKDHKVHDVKSQTRGTNQKNKLHKNITLKDLGKNVESRESVINYFKKERGNLVGKFGDNTGIDKLGGIATGSANIHIYNHIVQNLHYPKIFRKKNIEGFVNTRLVFDKKGNFVEKLTKIESNSGYLKVLVASTLRRIFKKPLPFNLSKTSHQYLLVDTSFRFLADANTDEKFIRTNAYINGRYLSFLVQNGGAGAIRSWTTENGNTSGGVGVQVSPGAIIDYFKENFTVAGKTRKMFYESQLNNYKNDPAWED